VRQILGVACLFASVLTISTWTNLLVYRRGHRKGHQEGYDRGYLQGRRSADNWWLGVESEVNGTRQQIWREKEKRG
jgi:hypothetical protein